MDLNKVQIIGNSTQDIELKATPGGQSVATISVATNREWKDGNGDTQKQAEFHNVVLWGKLAEIAHQYLKKGKKVYFEGRLQTRSWEAQDGSKRYRTEIVAENMILLGGNDSGTQAPQQNTQNSYAPKPAPKVEEEISIDDLPF